MAKIAKVQEVDIEKLIPYVNNAKIHGKEQVQKIVDSITEFGFLSPCLIDADYNIIAGHGRVMAATQMGMKKVPCVFIDGLSEEQKNAYILADNKLTELGDWDNEMVSSELIKLSDAGFDITLTGFSIDDIIFDDCEDEEAETVEAELANVEPLAQRGQVWQLGRHRLMCGDSTSMTDVLKLMGGAKADLLLTDPPYNVAVKNSQGMTIENDNMDDDEFFQFLQKAFACASAAMKEGASFYVWHASSTTPEFMLALKDNGLTVRQQIIWVKSSFVLSRQDYQWRHEPCLYGWKEGAAHYFIDLRSLTTVDDKALNNMGRDEAVQRLKDLYSDISTITYEDKPQKDDIHLTMKPVPLFKRQIRNSSREKDIVLDLFGGSGTTLIACEEMDRTCYMMEYDERYASAIIQRYADEYGEENVFLLNDDEIMTEVN